MTRLTIDRAFREMPHQNMNPVMFVMVIKIVQTMMQAADKLNAISTNDTRNIDMRDIPRLDIMSLHDVRYCSKNT